MAFSDNLQYLRKRDKITQEELADKLGVSRQSVSKWETGEAYPETDKLLVLCDLFDVTLDGLLREDLTAAPAVAQAAAEGREYARHMDSFSRGIALGVFLVLLGVAVCVALAGVSFYFAEPTASLLTVLGAVAVILFVAAAVFIFCLYGIRYDRFRKEHPVMDAVFDEKDVKAFTKRFAVRMACLVAGILIDVVFLILLTAFIDAGFIRAAHPDGACCYVTAVFLAVLGGIVGGLTYNGIQHTKYNVAEYNEQTRNELHPSPRSKLKDAICGAIMLTATALFLVLGFVGNRWHPGWVVFPVGGIFCAIVGTLLGAKDDHE